MRERFLVWVDKATAKPIDDLGIYLVNNHPIIPSRHCRLSLSLFTFEAEIETCSLAR